MSKFSELFTGKNMYDVFLHVALLASLVIIVVLAKQNQELKVGGTPAPQTIIRAGDNFSLDGLIPVETGRVLIIDSSFTKQLIFVFTTKCSYCKETIPLWKNLSDSASQKKSFPIVGICLDPLEETKTYVDQNQLTFPVFVPIDKESFSKNNNIESVPQTFIRKADGLVEHSWPGKLSADVYNKILKAITDGTIHKNL